MRTIALCLSLWFAIGLCPGIASAEADRDRDVSPLVPALQIGQADAHSERERVNDVALSTLLLSTAPSPSRPPPVRAPTPFLTKVYPRTVDNDIRSSALSAATLRRAMWSLGSRIRASRRSETLSISTPTLLRYGLSDRVEARLGSELLRVVGDDVGQPDVLVGTKVSLVQWHRLHVSGLADFRIDFADASRTARELRALALVNVGLANAWRLRGNIGMHAGFRDGTRNTSMAYAVELAFVLGQRTTYVPNKKSCERWAAVIGIAGDSNSADTIAIEGGVMRGLGSSWQVGVNGNIGVFGADDSLGGGVFLRWQPPRRRLFSQSLHPMVAAPSDNLSCHRNTGYR